MRLFVCVFATSLVACAANNASFATGSSTASSTQPIGVSSPTSASLALPVSTPDVELRVPNAAVVKGQPVAFDGIVEGHSWPALTKALPRAPSDRAPLTIQVERALPMRDVLRAVWTLRTSDLRVQSRDETGAMRVLPLFARREGAPSGAPMCHLAVLVKPDGGLRIAAPGGPRELGPERMADALSALLDSERVQCPLRYVAFGAMSSEQPWGPVFDLAVHVDAAKSAGDARLVLGEAMHERPRPR